MSKAVQMIARETAALVDVEDSSEPVQPDHVRGRTVASLISPGTEINYNYLGDDFPAQTGYAAVMQLEAVGEEITHVAPGDLVFCMGKHKAQQDADRTIIKLPEGLDPTVAVFARLIGVSFSTMTTTNARPPARIAVTGLGPVGHLAAQLFASCGYNVIGCDIDAKRRDLLANKGIAVCEKLEEGANYALVVECTGHEGATLDACKAVRKGGEVVLVGVPWRKLTDIDAQSLTYAVFHNYVHLRSGWEWEVPTDPQAFSRSSITENIAGAMQYLADGKINVEGLAAVRKPADCQDVYQDLLHRRGPLSAVFDWS